MRCGAVKNRIAVVRGRRGGVMMRCGAVKGGIGFVTLR